MADKIKWGILGCSKQSRSFAQGLAFVDDAKLTAVASRSLERAKQFADEFGIEKSFGSYDELADCTELDIIYIATPHLYHKSHCQLCLSHGKAVLCEKPFTINAKEAREIAEMAKEKSLFAMEAMTARFVPAVDQVRQWLKQGVIGEVKAFIGNFGVNFNPDHRTFNQALGGGALLELGVYPVSMASMVFGRQPKSIATVGDIGETGVDMNSSTSFLYDKGQVADISCSAAVRLPNHNIICGSTGKIWIYNPASRAVKVGLERPGQEVQIQEFPLEGSGMCYELREVCKCLREGKTQSRIMGLDESVAIMETMDEIRRQWGLKYPGE